MTGESPNRMVGRLKTTLDEIGDALVAGRLEELLSAEPVVERMLARWPARLGTEVDRRALAMDVARARASLLRCRRLGASMHDFARMLAETRGALQGYDEAGREREPDAPHAFETRA